MSAEILSFETGRPAVAEQADDDVALVVDVEGYEGPLDLLLNLARQQKVDLAKISILALADQYLVFIEAARKYTAHLTTHMRQEEAILFRLAEELLDATDREAVTKDFRLAEAEFGASTVKQYEKLAESLEQRWAL